MGRVIYMLVFVLFWTCSILADDTAVTNDNDSFRSARDRAQTNSQQNDSSSNSEFRSARDSQQLDLDTSTVTKSSKQSIRIESYTVFESNIFPGFRTCTPEDYRKQDGDPIACQDDDVARMLSTRSADERRNDLVVKDNVVPDGNIYKLRFQRFKRKKQ